MIADWRNLKAAITFEGIRSSKGFEIYAECDLPQVKRNSKKQPSERSGGNPKLKSFSLLVIVNYIDKILINSAPTVKQSKANFPLNWLSLKLRKKERIVDQIWTTKMNSSTKKHRWFDLWHPRRSHQNKNYTNSCPKKFPTLTKIPKLIWKMKLSE